MVLLSAVCGETSGTAGRGSGRSRVTFDGEVRGGKLDADTRQWIADYIRTFDGKRIAVTVKLHKATRSTRANRYYWGVVVKMLAEHCGYDPDEMHQALAMKFLRIEDCPVTGVPRRKSTPKCDTTEFAEYVDCCIRLAAELGVVIPDSNTIAA